MTEKKRGKPAPKTHGKTSKENTACGLSIKPHHALSESGLSGVTCSACLSRIELHRLEVR